MATRLNKQSLGLSRRSRYDWDEWLDGSVWEGRQGEDFECKVQSFVSQLYKAAYDRNKKIRVSPKDNGVVEWEVVTDNDATKSNAVA